jgi:hypothetical protein
MSLAGGCDRVRAVAGWRQRGLGRGRGARCGRDRLPGDHLERIGRIRSWAPEVALDHGFEIREDGVIECEFPLEIRTHLPLHLVDLPQVEHALGDNRPGLVAVDVVADDFRGDHEGGDEEAVARAAAGSGKAGLEALE